MIEGCQDKNLINIGKFEEVLKCSSRFQNI